MALMLSDKVAIVSDVTMEYGGAEKVVDCFLEMFPEADLYTLLMAPAAMERIRVKYPKVKIKTSIFQKLVRSNTISKYISVIKILSWIYWELLDLKEYGTIIASSHSYMSKNIRRRGKSVFLAYIHTPPRYLYDEFSEINWIRSGIGKYLFWPVKEILRAIDKNGSRRPDILVANSKNVQNRIKKYYRRKAEIVYPPVDVRKSRKAVARKDYYVCLSRLVKQKGIDLAVKVCSSEGYKLMIIGDGDERRRLQDISGRSVVFLGKCSEEQKIKVLSEARALIFTSKDEDFGIVPVEALKMGVPVIAYRSGGVVETVFDMKNGFLFSREDENSLKKAIGKERNFYISGETCIKSVQQFSKNNFKKQIKHLLKRMEKTNE